MTAVQKVLKFISSKWFVLFLGLGLMTALPSTWHNLTVVFKAGQMATYWWIVLVFACNVLAVGFATYKFMSLLEKKVSQTSSAQEW